MRRALPLAALALGACLAPAPRRPTPPPRPSRARATAEAERARKLERYFANKPGLPGIVKEAIRDGKVIVGMSEDEVLMAWGRPDRVVKAAERLSDTDQWIYGPRYLYFQSGRVVP